tara:strand:- start:2175 stop:2768 length:594 start_codon:yes stop_codon:yes gene_type:complete
MNIEDNLPNSYENLDQTLDAAHKILDDAVDNTKTLFHTLVVSSYDGNSISSRVMVLREFDLTKRIMRFHTDKRALKIKHFSELPTSTVLGYDPDLKIQIKLQGKISIHLDDSISEDAWNGSTSRSKKCYSVKGGSTKEIEDPQEYDIEDFNVEDGYKNFAVLMFKFKSLEFLYLKSSGHRRAIHRWDENKTSTWLVP